jgi:CDP-diacylglycerol---glycerol-3-phosphate 3-phosphatidyltransferase
MTDTKPRYSSAGLATPANIITFSRIIGSPVLFWLILEAEVDRGTSWAVFTIGLVFAISDLFDGRIARATGSVTRSGAFLDPLADKVVVLGCSISLIVVGRYDWLPVSIIIIRELWVSLMRVTLARRGISVPATRLAKWKTTLQGAALLAAVMPSLESEDVAVEGMLWIAVAITVITGWQYVRDSGSYTDEQ